MFRGVFSSLCLLVVVQYGAGNHVEVTSYDEIIQALLDGHHLNVVINIVECGSELPGNTTNAITSLPIKFWSWVQRSDSTTSFEFRHTFITPFDDSYNYENVAVTMSSAGSVTVEVTYFIPTTDGISNEVVYTCALGGGVRVFDHNGGEVWDRASSYDEVKAALVSGRHVDRVINYSGCNGSPIGGNPNRIMGSNNELSYVIRNDIPREHIEFVDQEFIHLGDDSSMDIFAVTTIGNPNGDIGVRTEIWQLVTWDSDLHSILTCGYSDVVSFTLEPEEDEVEYMTYDEMVQGLLTGHELEVIFDTFDCTSIPDGGPGPHRIYIENIQQWTMGEWENGTFVRFSTNHFRNDIDPEIIFEEFDVFSDGSMIANSFLIDPASGQIRARRAYQCEIGSSARLFGFDGDTTRITDFSELAQAVEMGYHMTTVVDYSMCNSTIVGGETALYVGIAFYELFEVTDESGTYVATEHRNMVGLDNSVAIFSLPGTFLADGTVTWDLALLVPDPNGGVMNLIEGSQVICDISGGAAVFKDERSN